MLQTLTASLHSLSLSSPFLHGSKPQLTRLTKPSSPPPPSLSSRPSSSSLLPSIRAMRSMQGRVVCNSSDKTVAVEVTRLAPHPKYKRRVRIKKKFQAHDPLNQFQVGDWVQLEKSRPVSKTKTFVAIAVPARTSKKQTGEGDGGSDLPVAQESQLVAA